MTVKSHQPRPNKWLVIVVGGGMLLLLLLQTNRLVLVSGSTIMGRPIEWDMEPTTRTMHVQKNTTTTTAQEKNLTAVMYDQRSFIIHGRRTLLLSGSIHYTRVPPSDWNHVFLLAKVTYKNQTTTIVHYLDRIICLASKQTNKSY